MTPQTTAPCEPDADLLRICGDVLKSLAAAQVAQTERDEHHPDRLREDRLIKRALRIVPTSLAGHSIRALAVLGWHGGIGGNGEPASEFNYDMVWPIIRDLIGADAIEAAAAFVVETNAAGAS